MRNLWPAELRTVKRSFLNIRNKKNLNNGIGPLLDGSGIMQNNAEKANVQ